MLSVHEQRLAELIEQIKPLDQPTRTLLVGRYAWQECAGLYADNDALRDFLRQGKAQAEQVFACFFNRLIEAGCDPTRARALALHHAGCGEYPL